MADINTLVPGTYTVDAAHSTVGFVARHLMITKVRGRFTSFSGNVEIASNPLDSTVEATVDLGSVDTGDAGRDGHLKGADFFGVDENPTMTFASTGIKQDGGEYRLFGDLTIKGVTRNVEFDLEFEGTGTDPWNNAKAGFTAEADINRKDWGIEWNVALETGGVLVSDKIKIQLDIQLVKA